MTIANCLYEMGCGSTKLTSSAHVASSPDLSDQYTSKHRVDGDATKTHGLEEMATSSAPSTGNTDVVFKSFHDTIFSEGTTHCYSRTTGIKGNATFTVTLSSDGSLLEIETVTMGTEETVSHGSSPEANDSYNSSRDVTTRAQITSVPENLSGMRSVNGNRTIFVKSDGKTSTPYTSVHCIALDEECIHQHPDESTNDLENDTSCNCTGKTVNCQSGRVSHCTSLPDIKIKDKCFGGEKELTSVSLVDSISFHGNYSRQPSPVTKYRYFVNSQLNDQTPGGESRHNYPSNSSSFSEGFNHLGNCNLQNTPSNTGSVDDRQYQSNTSSSQSEQNKPDSSSHKYTEANSPGNILRQTSATTDYTCLGYCARKCYNNPSLPRLSSRAFTVDVKGSSRPMVASYSFSTESTNTSSKSAMVYSSSESANRGANLGINLQESDKSTMSSAYSKNSSDKKKGKQKHSKGQLPNSPQSGIFAISSQKGLSAFLSRSISSPRQQSPTHLTNTCSLTPKAKNKSCLRLLKTKALSEDVPCAQSNGNYVRQSTSFDGHPTTAYGHSESSGDEKTQAQSNLNNCDVSYVHQDFFNGKL